MQHLLSCPETNVRSWSWFFTSASWCSQWTGSIIQNLENLDQKIYKLLDLQDWRSCTRFADNVPASGPVGLDSLAMMECIRAGGETKVTQTCNSVPLQPDGNCSEWSTATPAANFSCSTFQGLLFLILLSSWLPEWRSLCISCQVLVWGTNGKHCQILKFIKTAIFDKMYYSICNLWRLIEWKTYIFVYMPSK